MTALPKAPLYARPDDLTEALRLLSGGEATIVAGATDLMVQMQAGKKPLAGTLLDIGAVDEIRGVEKTAEGIVIGATTSMTDILEDRMLGDVVPALVSAADQFASDQIRNAATIGGNIVNASPAGDTLVPLLVYRAEVTLARLKGDDIIYRTLPLGEFLQGPGTTAIARGELLTHIRLPLPPVGLGGRFYKFGTRPALDIATVSIGLGGRLEEGCFTDIRIAFGAVGPKPFRATATEAALSGRPADGATIEAAVAIARGEIHPIDDVRASAWYRAEMITNMLKRMLLDVAQG